MDFTSTHQTPMSFASELHVSLTDQVYLVAIRSLAFHFSNDTILRLLTSNIGRCREKQEFESIEGLIDDLSAQKQDIERQLAVTKDDYELMAELSQHLENLSEMIDTKTDRWLELAELAEASHA